MSDAPRAATSWDDPSVAGRASCRTPATLRRRRFLCAVLGGGGAATLAGLYGPAPPARRHRGASSPLEAAGNEGCVPVRRGGRALGANVQVSVWHGDPRHAHAVIDQMFVELERIEQIMSIYRPESELSRLNRERRLARPHPYLVEVLRAAASLSERSAGAFDVTVQPLWELWSQMRRTGRPPSQRQLDLARRRVDWRRVLVEDDSVRLVGDTAVTLNGIAQGFAADAVTRLFRAAGIRDALIDSGETMALGAKPARTGWRVGVLHPRRPETCLAAASLADRALATSGDYATRFDQGFNRHHLFDPRTGTSAGHLASVSVVADTALWADGLSTAAFVLGEHQGKRLVERTPGAEALFITKDGLVRSTPEMPLVWAEDV